MSELRTAKNPNKPSLAERLQHLVDDRRGVNKAVPINLSSFLADAGATQLGKFWLEPLVCAPPYVYAAISRGR